MFAKSEWFHRSSLSFLPGPRTSPGWAFYALCLLGIWGPTLLLVARNQVFPEALIWLACSSAAWWIEVRGLNRELREQEARRQLFVIDDAPPATVETRHYEMELRGPVQGS